MRPGDVHAIGAGSDGGVRQRLGALTAAIDAASVGCGRHDRPDIVAVTKGFGAEAIAAAADAGLDKIGENYAQELLSKREVIDPLRARSMLTVQFIGRLQTNKVRHLVDVVDVFASVDRPSLVDELAKRAPGARILVQVNTTGEATKGGCPPDETAALVDRAHQRGLVVDGLMTVGPTVGPAESARSGFRAVRRLVDELGLNTCSMGMSDDLRVAVEEGSTQLRIGSALFGARPVGPDVVHRTTDGVE